jgi:PAS domain S-box-containing protein
MFKENELLGEKFKMLTDASPDCIKLFNLKNEVLFMNPGGLREHGFKSLEEAQGFDWTKSIVVKQRKEVLDKIKESVEQKKAVALDVQHLPELANREWCSLSINPVFDEHGEVKYFVGISRDISDRKKMENEENESFVDRELKMVELKKQNEDLKAALEKAKQQL